MANVSFSLWHANGNKNKSKRNAQEPKYTIYLVVSFGGQAREGRLKYPTGKEIERNVSSLHRFIETFLERAPSRVNIHTGKNINDKEISGYKRTYDLLRQYEK